MLSQCGRAQGVLKRTMKTEERCLGGIAIWHNGGDKSVILMSRYFSYKGERLRFIGVL